jgi:hypothetical protein
MCNRKKLTNCVLCAAAVAGCQSAAEPVAITPATAAADVSEPTAKPANSDAKSPGVAEAAEQPLAAAEFSPPFPERVELFEAPRRAQSTVRRDNEDGETVELKGFVNVDAPRVVLSIDGVISPIAEGDEKYGVQVISIQPPSVVLQRGRNRWTATLE